MSLISCDNLAFAYDGVTVLHGLNFKIEQGDYLCILGENGAGKSPLMKGLLGLKKPSAGTVTFMSVAVGYKGLTGVGFLLLLMYVTMGHNMWNWPLPAWFQHNHLALTLTQMLLALIVMVINRKFFTSGFSSSARAVS